MNEMMRRKRRGLEDDWKGKREEREGTEGKRRRKIDQKKRKRRV